MKRASAFSFSNGRGGAWSVYVFAVFAIVVILCYAVIDVNLLGRVLFSWKDKWTSDEEERFEEKKGTGVVAGTSNKDIGGINGVSYVNVTAAVLVGPEDKMRKVSATKNSDQCKDSCTFDDACSGFVFDGLKNDCRLLYDISGYVRNSDGLYTTKSGVKLRDYIGLKDPDRKYMRFEGMELPPDGKGKIATHQFVPNVDACKMKCLDNQQAQQKCIAFEYDFKNKACTLNSEVQGKLGTKEQKDVYVLIN